MAEPHPIPSHKRFQDLTGRTFGELVILFYAGPIPGHQLWAVRCKRCGEESTARANNLLTGHTTTCGCLQADMRTSGVLRTTHGESRSPEWAVWQRMKNRCGNSSAKDFHNYGGRGITVCERWRNSFAAFIADLGKRQSRAHTLDRIDNDGNYEPSNCRWRTRKEQARNKRNNVHIVAKGESLLLTEWAAKLGIHHSVIINRIKRGWPPEKAVTTPPIPGRGRRRKSLS